MAETELDRVQAKIEELIQETPGADRVRSKIQELIPETKGGRATSPAVGYLLVQADKFARKAAKYPEVGSFLGDAVKFLRKAVKQIELERRMERPPPRPGRDH